MVKYETIVKTFFKIVDKTLMTKAIFDEKFELFLFIDPEEKLGTSKLGEFLSFLKYNKATQPYKFSYVSQTAALIPEMSLIQNILVDFNPNSLTESKEVQFHEFLLVQPNRALEHLYRKILLPQDYPHQSNAQMKKVSSLIKTLISDGQFIFLEEPENDLDQDSLNLFIEALKFQLDHYQTNILIYSKNHELWKPHSHKTIERNKDYSFKITEISSQYLWEHERQIFYSKSSENRKENGLKFIIPQRIKDKKEAA